MTDHTERMMRRADYQAALSRKENGLEPGPDDERRLTNGDPDEVEVAEMCLLCHDQGGVNFKCRCGRDDAHHPVANSKHDANGEPHDDEGLI